MVTVLQVTTQGKTRLFGVKEAAEVLGVTRQHLHLVAKGERKSPRIEKWLAKNMRRVS